MKISHSPWINGNMDIWQKGRSMAAPAAVGGYQCDFIGHRGNVSTVFVECMDFEPGQTEVPGKPKHFFRITVGSVPGATNYALVASDIDNVGLFAGTKATVAWYGRVNGNKSVSFAADQYFGSGGSPSNPVTLPAQKNPLNSAWARQNTTFEFPSVEGKSLGTSKSDTHRIGFVYFLDAGSSRDAETDNLGQQDIVFDFARVSVHEDPDEIIQFVEDPYNRTYAEDLIDCLSLMQVFTETTAFFSGPTVVGKNYWKPIEARVPMVRTPIPYVTKSAVQNGFAGPVNVSAVDQFGVQLISSATSAVPDGHYTVSLILDANHPYTP